MMQPAVQNPMLSDKRKKSSNRKKREAMTKKGNNTDLIEEMQEFKGYTMEELRYQRAMMALRKEFCKAKVLESLHKVRPGKKSGVDSAGSPKFATATRIASKLLSNLNTLDYVLMGISLFGTVKKGYRLIRGKK